VAIGLSDLDLGPFGIEAHGTFIVAGSPGAGHRRRRDRAADAARAARHARVLHRRPAIARAGRRRVDRDRRVSSAAMAVLGAVDEAADRARAGGPVPLVVLEGIGEFATSIIEMNLSTLVKRAGRGEVFFVVVGEMSEWTTNFGCSARSRLRGAASCCSRRRSTARSSSRRRSPVGAGRAAGGTRNPRPSRQDRAHPVPAGVGDVPVGVESGALASSGAQT
jgi:S-DNA-T family DNA segregation ATPase FtsK/SpoIIIE